MRLIDADKLKQHYAWLNNKEKELFDQIVDAQPTVKPLPYGKNTTICGEDGCDGCLYQHRNNIELCKEEARQNGFNIDEYVLISDAKKQGWISVKDELPPLANEVLLFVSEDRRGL